MQPASMLDCNVGKSVDDTVYTQAVFSYYYCHKMLS